MLCVLLYDVRIAQCLKFILAVCFENILNKYICKTDKKRKKPKI